MARIHSTNPNYSRDIENLKFYFYRSYDSDREMILGLIEQLPEDVHFRATEAYNDAYLKSGRKIANAKLEKFCEAILDKLNQKIQAKSDNVRAMIDRAKRTPEKAARVKVRLKR